MTDLGFIFLLSALVLAVDYRQTAWNMSVPWNGLGAIGNILSGHALQPMQYRIFVPFLVRMVSKSLSPVWYLAVKWVGILFAFLASYWLWGMAGMGEGFPFFPLALLALFFCVAARYDYADSYWEYGFFAMSMVLMGLDGVWPVIVLFIMAIVAGTNRETAVFIPLIALFSGFIPTFILTGFGVAVGLMLPRMEYGKKRRYCQLVMIRENLSRWRKDHYYIDFAALLLLVVWFAFTGADTGAEWALLLLFFVLLVPSIWSEIRVFSPIMVVLIPAISYSLL